MKKIAIIALLIPTVSFGMMRSFQMRTTDWMRTQLNRLTNANIQWSLKRRNPYAITPEDTAQQEQLKWNLTNIRNKEINLINRETTILNEIEIQDRRLHNGLQLLHKKGLMDRMFPGLKINRIQRAKARIDHANANLNLLNAEKENITKSLGTLDTTRRNIQRELFDSMKRRYQQ